MSRFAPTLFLAAILFSTAAGAAEPPPVSTSPARPSTRLFADSRLVILDRISVEVVGRGPDLVFIPGLASSRETWRATAERLRGHYRLHLVQVAGFAGEAARANATGAVLVPTAEAIDAYLVDQKLAPAVIVGHSLGGTMALWLAEHHPEHLNKVLLVDSLPFFATLMMGPGATVDQVRPMAERMRTAPPQSDDARDKMIFGMVTGQSDRTTVAAWGKASDPVVVDNALADDVELDLRPGLATLRIPITLLYPDYLSVGMPAGAADASYGAAYAAVPRKTLKRIDKSLHFIMFDQPAAFAAALDEFLGS